MFHSVPNIICFIQIVTSSVCNSFFSKQVCLLFSFYFEKCPACACDFWTGLCNIFFIYGTPLWHNESFQTYLQQLLSAPYLESDTLEVFLDSFSGKNTFVAQNLDMWSRQFYLIFTVTLKYIYSTYCIIIIIFSQWKIWSSERSTNLIKVTVR